MERYVKGIAFGDTAKRRLKEIEIILSEWEAEKNGNG